MIKKYISAQKVDPVVPAANSTSGSKSQRSKSPVSKLDNSDTDTDTDTDDMGGGGRKRPGKGSTSSTSGNAPQKTTDASSEDNHVDIIFNYRTNVGLLRWPDSLGESWLTSGEILQQRINIEKETAGDLCVLPKYSELVDKTYCSSKQEQDLGNFLKNKTYIHMNDVNNPQKVSYISEMFGGKKKRKKKTRTNRKKSLRHNKPKLTIIKRRFKSKKRKGKKRNKTRKRKN